MWEILLSRQGQFGMKPLLTLGLSGAAFFCLIETHYYYSRISGTLSVEVILLMWFMRPSNCAG